MSDHNCIVLLGPTASGKTKIACRLAYWMNGEVISADSRQVYRGLDIGTGKDLHEFYFQGQAIPYHLIDIAEPAQQSYLHDFIRECAIAFDLIRSKDHLPVICGGTGLYLDALRKDFSYTQIPEDHGLRRELADWPLASLRQKLNSFPPEWTMHADTHSKKRLIRAIEIAGYLSMNAGRIKKQIPVYKPYYLGVNVSVEQRRKNISERLDIRLQHGLVEEVEALLEKGLSHERLQELGLEYKFVSLFIQKKIDRHELRQLLFTAICQFAKRQMTWFRKMEREGVAIRWIAADTDIEILAAELKELF